jgi:Protein of unknown function (DUF1631)
MSKAPGHSRKTETAPVALVDLASRRDLPQRVRNLLEGVHGLCGNFMEQPLGSSLTEFEQQLFKLAERAHTNAESQRCFETLREVKRGRSDVAPRFLLSLEDSLANFDRSAKVKEHAAEKSRTARTELSLVDSKDLEETLALQELAAKAEIRQAQALYALGHRFGVLAGSPALDAESLPVGPARLGAALRHAAACLDIVPEHRVLFYHTFERIALGESNGFYDAINNYFIEQRILRHLRGLPPRYKSGSGKGSGAEAPGQAPQTPETPPPTPAQNQQDPRGPAPNFQSQGMGGLPSGLPSFSAAAALHRQANPPGDPRSGDPRSADPRGNDPQAGAQRGAPADERDSELFTTLRELLAGRRHALGMPPGQASNKAFMPSGEDVQSVLSVLQSKPIAPLVLGGKVVQRSVAQIKQDLLAQLRQLAPDGQAPQLMAEDSDTIDLVGMLFDYIMKDVRAAGSTQAMLAKLQVPLLRVALKDKSFFTRRAHPARQLLNAIAETGQHWMDDQDGESDSALIEKMNLVVERVTGEFDGNLGLIEDLLGNLSQHMHTLARKAEVAERRHVTAAKGREKLALARETAGEAISGRIATSRPGPLVRTLLEQAWTDVLALTLLRQGEKSETYKKQLDVADQLIAASTAARGESMKAPAPALREQIESGLSQVGYHKDDIQAVVKRLFVPEAAANEDNAPTQTDLAMKLKSRARLGEDSTDERPMQAAAQRRAALQLNTEERQMLERLRGVPFGTWFEFATNQQGDRVRRKLSWFSPLTGRCLFVNQRGARTDERSLEQLARDMVRGQANILKPENDSLVDRAWKAIVGSLRNLTGRGGTPEPVPA